ncbi:sugar transferase [Citroniella saccharovorans]|uniref:Sugar transferase n=1 Tax=Citroniella saccharovorans TaxID=2053367 RepID=A0AAW9MU09_9FIRM|nr:sugar transferase [Citroniella saccharovorans]MEB3429099.1 sugar transferase [Citroniella saccharovorans]
MVKRFFDIVLSAIGLLILLIPLIIIAIIIKLDSEGPVIFKQVRIGKGEVPFNIYKFRTMVVCQDKNSSLVTRTKDKRITKVGAFLRKAKLDEFPQLFNVLLGDMSIVGPRPEVSKYVAYYTKEEKKVFLVRPGITDLASIEYRNEQDILENSNDPEKTYIEEIMKEKLKLNQKYIENMSFLFDLKLIFKTFAAILN